MPNSRIIAVALLLSLVISPTGSVVGAERQGSIESSSPSRTIPVWDDAKVNNSGLAPIVSNSGNIGFFEYPRGTDLSYGYQSDLIFGCVRGVDTLVTYAGVFEFTSFQHLQRLSSDQTSPDYDPQARAIDELHAVFSDTGESPAPIDNLDLREHKPIGLSIHQKALSWDAGIAQQILFLDWTITVVSEIPLQGSYVGVKVQPMTVYHPNWPTSIGGSGSRNPGGDICGFMCTAPAVSPGYLDTLMTAWSADNDGDPSESSLSFDSRSVQDVLGVRILRVSPQTEQMSFNWWAREATDSWPSSFDWGPRLTSSKHGYAGSLGSPWGDRSLYWMMRNGEIDYDQVKAALDMTHEGWSPPSPDRALMNAIAGGSYIGYLLVAGPLPELRKGDEIHFTVAYVIGRDFHTSPSNYITNFAPQNPQPFVENLDFTDLIESSRWADWIFDNPGVDTDGDGNRGRAYALNCRFGRCDSVFYKGDGVPDWRGPSAPPPPPFELTTSPSSFTLRWTGAISETHVDAFSGVRDFEGYRLYLGKFDRNDQYSLVASWDRDNYERVAYDPRLNEWTVVSYPRTESEWARILGIPGFAFDVFGVKDFDLAFRDTVVDTIFSEDGSIARTEERTRFSYWQQHGYNRSNSYFDEGRLESNIIQRVAVRDTIIDDDTLSYGVYEASVDKLNASVPLYVAVTAFDFGDYLRRVPSRESFQSSNSEYAEFIYSTDAVIDSGLKVTVFPNPYKLAYQDGRGSWTSYFEEGYEGRGVREFAEQDRRVHFINLPDTATISIYTLDGDLVRRIHHPDPFLTTYPSSVGWDLVTRNVQAAVSGIYIWKVDSRLGSQVGKLVIIK